jgi:N-acetylglucosamine kinase-like BadF-type ATPase
VGVDGGGSKTLALAEDGAAQRRGNGGPANLYTVGFQAACTAIEQAIADAVAGRGRPGDEQITALCLGLAGVGRPEEAARFFHWAHAKYPDAALEVVGDGEILLAAGAPTGAALALVCGTGSIAYGRTAAGVLIRVGGWGYLFGDEGSGFAIGAAALRAVMQAHDGRGAPTMLTRLILAARGLTAPPGLVQNLYAAPLPRVEIASLARLVEQAAEQGDPTALEILHIAAQELVQLVDAVARAMGEKTLPLALTGGVILNLAHLRAEFQRLCAAQALTFSPLHLIPEPAQGALVRARALLSADK